MSDFDPNPTVRFLIGQRAKAAVLTDHLPDGLRPPTIADVIAVQMATLAEIGPIGGWKVGAADAAAEPIASPLPAQGIMASPAVVSARSRGAECEISFRFATSLPPRDTPYRRDEVMAAIESCQATIEVVDPRFRSHDALDRFTTLSDLGVHGALAVGMPIAEWTEDMFATLAVVMFVDGVQRLESVGSNPGGSDLIRLLVWLANSPVARAAGGIAAGHVVTTGSWTGMVFNPPGAHVTAHFTGFPPVEVRFGPY